MANKITLTANDGSVVEFYDEIKAQGGVKDVYFSPDKTYVVAFYRKPINANDRERITNIVGIYRQRIFDTQREIIGKICLHGTTKMVEWNGKTGIIMPFYDKKFFLLFRTIQRQRKKRGSGLLPLNCVTNSCLLTKKGIG